MAIPKLTCLMVALLFALTAQGSVATAHTGTNSPPEVTNPSQPTPMASPKTKKCHRCLDWRLECVEKDKEGNCKRWKGKCYQWEDYPC
jgi:hypothetical protein